MNGAGGEKTGTNSTGPDGGPETRPDAASRIGDPAPAGSPPDPGRRFARFLAARERIRARPGQYRVYRLVVAVVGLGIVGGGIALVPLPGPGWVIVFLGLHVLATEFAWAAAVERFARRQVSAWTSWIGRRPLAVRLGLGALTVAAVLAVVYGLFVISGVPSWIPESWVPDLPGLH